MVVCWGHNRCLTVMRYAETPPAARDRVEWGLPDLVKAHEPKPSFVITDNGNTFVMGEQILKRDKHLAVVSGCSSPAWAVDSPGSPS